MTESQINEKIYGFFTIKTIRDVVILNFREDFLLRVPDLSTRDTLMDYLNHYSENDLKKVLVVMGSSKKSGKEEYFMFYKQALDSDLGFESIQRMYNVVDQIILAIMGLNQIVIHANSGKVISIFLNMSLACDYRIVADNTIFQNPYIDLGTVPKGGGAFFISKKMGSGKAYEILLSEKNITAQEAFRLGIVDRVVPLERLEESALNVANWFSRKPKCTLEGVKKLINQSKEGVIKNLELENKEIDRITSDSSFWKRVEEHVFHDN